MPSQATGWALKDEDNRIVAVEIEECPPGWWSDLEDFSGYRVVRVKLEEIGDE